MEIGTVQRSDNQSEIPSGSRVGGHAHAPQWLKSPDFRRSCTWIALEIPKHLAYLGTSKFMVQTPCDR